MVLGGLEYRGHRDVFSSVYNSIRTGPLDEALLKIIHRFFHRDNLLLRTFTYPCLTTSIPGVSIVSLNVDSESDVLEPRNERNQKKHRKTEIHLLLMNV